MTDLSRAGEAAQETAPDALWTPEQASLIEFSGRVLHSMAYSLTKHGLPRAPGWNASPDWPDRGRAEFVVRSRASGVLMVELAEAAAEEASQEELGLAGQVLDGLSRHTKEYGRPRLNLRKLGIHDVDRKDFGARLFVTHKVVAHLLETETAE